MSDLKQIVLRGSGYSGRGVRLALLTQTQLDAINVEAARAPVDKDASDVEKQSVYTGKRRELGLPAMVVEVTANGGFKSLAALHDAKWTKLAPDANLSNYFTPKDLDLLADAFFRFHFAMKAEVDDILGEAQDVASD